MNVLWFGGEDTDFPTFVNGTADTSAGLLRAGYARCSICCDTGGYGKSTLFPGGAIASGWLSFRLRNSGGNNAGNLMVGLGKSSTAKSGLFLSVAAASGSKIAITKYDGSTKTELAAESGNSIPSSASIYKIDMQLINYGATASVNVWVDGAQVITYGPGDVTVSGVANVDSVFLGATSYGEIHYSEIIVADSDTRNLSMTTHYLNAAGDVNDMTGDYTDIDEVTINDGDLIYDNTVGHRAMFGLSDLPAGTFWVLAVKETIRATKSAASTPTHLKIGVKSGTVEDSDSIALTTAWATYERYMPVNPVTSSPFTMAEMNALQLVLESDT